MRIINPYPHYRNALILTFGLWAPNCLLKARCRSSRTRFHMAVFNVETQKLITARLPEYGILSATNVVLQAQNATKSLAAGLRPGPR